MLDITRLPPRPDATRDACAGTTATTGFAELVCSDPAWVDAEFDAIMTANFGVLPAWPPPLPPQPRPGATGPRHPGRAPRTAGSGEEFLAVARRGRPGGRRE